MFDIITIAEMFIYSAFFVRECMFLCSDKKSSVRFADVRRITTRAGEFINKPIKCCLERVTLLYLHVSFKKQKTCSAFLSCFSIKVFVVVTKLALFCRLGLYAAQVSKEQPSSAQIVGEI